MKNIVFIPLIAIMFSCSNSDDSSSNNCQNEPSIETLNASNITTNTATINGIVTPPTCTNIIVSSKGFVYSITSNPTFENNIVYTNTSGENLSSEITDLNSSTIYYVRAFLQDNINTYYGNEITFETNMEALTYVPDDNFEMKLIDLGYDDVMDDYVITNNINDIPGLVLDDLGISDLTGIEDFESLFLLHANNNNLTEIDLTNNVNLQFLELGFNNINEIDLSQNTQLFKLNIGFNNLTELNLTNNNQLELFLAAANNLEFVNLANGSNSIITELWLIINPNVCVQIDNGFTPPNCGSGNEPFGWCIDTTANYSFDCQ